MSGKKQCPQCQKYVKCDDVCPQCGFSFKREEERKKAYIDQAADRYSSALKNQDYNSAFEALGILRSQNEKTVPILHTNLLLGQERFQEVIDVLKTANLPTEDMKTAALSHLLTAYAANGDYVEFIRTVQKSQYHITYWESAYYMILLREKNTQEEIEKKVEILRNKYHITNPDYQVYYEEESEDALFFKRQVLQYLSKTLAEGIALKRRFLFAKEINGDTLIPQSAKEKSLKYDWIMQEYISLDCPDDQQEERRKILRRLIALNKDDSWSLGYIAQAADIITQWLTKDIIGSDAIDNILVYSGCLLKLGHYIRLNSIVKKNAETLISGYKNGSTSIRKEIREIALKTFSYEYVVNQQDPAVHRLLQTCEIEPASFKEETENMMLYSVLTSTAQSALIVADYFFEKSRTEDFCFIDAGPISLNYFRIIELELNNRLIQALVANLSTEELTKAYKADLEALNEKEKESYKKKWDRLLSDLKKIEEKKLHGITLGSLAIYMGQLRHFKQKGLCLVDCLWSKLDEILTEEGKTAFLRGDLEDMIKQEILEKYRNPPAHTRYLSYQTACECKEYVTKSIITLHAWFKVI